MGKVTLAEYESTRGRFMREAAEVLRDLNQQSGTLDAKINREIAELQALARKSAGPLDRAEEHRE
jgi:sigma54-dependent transcription regulator